MRINEAFWTVKVIRLMYFKLQNLLSEPEKKKNNSNMSLTVCLIFWKVEQVLLLYV